MDEASIGTQPAEIAGAIPAPALTEVFESLTRQGRVAPIASCEKAALHDDLSG
jgi:hypothetical protein